MTVGTNSTHIRDGGVGGGGVGNGISGGKSELVAQERDNS